MVFFGFYNRKGSTRKVFVIICFINMIEGPYMIITKVINNNVVSSHDEKGIEVIVMGKGVGFQKKAKDKIEKSKIEKVFHLSNELQDKLAELVSNIPYEYLVLTDEVVAEAGSVLGKKLSKNIYLTLAVFSITDCRNGC